MEKVWLYTNTSKPLALQLSKLVEEKLKALGYVITSTEPDIVIGFGGDGTLIDFLRSSKYTTGVKYIGVNCGTLGFLQDFDIQSVDDFVTNIPSYSKQKLDFISASICTDSGILNFDALNEFYICTSNDSTLRMNISAMNEFLENYVGTGMIFSSATGSTARNISSIGTILFPTMEIFQMTPCEATFNSALRCLPKSICFPKEAKVCLVPNGNNNIKVIADGRKIFDGVLNKIIISYSKNYITKLTYQNNSFISKIREKLI